MIEIKSMTFDAVDVKAETVKEIIEGEMMPGREMEGRILGLGPWLDQLVVCVTDELEDRHKMFVVVEPGDKMVFYTLSGKEKDDGQE